MADPAATTKRWNRDSIGNTILVAIGVSVICSLLVTTSVVMLRPIQQQNEFEFKHRVTVLQLTGRYEAGLDVDEQFGDIASRLVELESGEYSEIADPATFDLQRAANDPDLGVKLPEDADPAGLGRRSRFAPVFMVREDGALDQVVLPVYGAGMWSTLYGYLAVDADGMTVRGLRFYEHGETPGVGDQIEDPEWLAKWPGKQIYDDSGEVAIEVARRKARGRGAELYKIDGISGASRTAQGVSELIRYWLGPDGYKPYLDKLQEQHDGSS